MPIKRKDRENSNEINGVKLYRMDHIPTDHELFLQAFESKYPYCHFSLPNKDYEYLINIQLFPFQNQHRFIGISGVEIGYRYAFNFELRVIFALW